MLGKRRDLFVNALAILAILSIPAVAQAAGPGLGSSGIMNEVLHRFRDATQEWLPAIQAAAERLFLALTVISMVWTFGLMLLKKADIGEFFAELIAITFYSAWTTEHFISNFFIVKLGNGILKKFFLAV